MTQPPAAQRIARIVCALLVALSLTFFNVSSALAQVVPRTFLCDAANSSDGNPNTCWSVFKNSNPKYLRVTGSSAQCKVSTRCWNKDLPADNCKQIDPTGSPNIRPCQ